MTPTPCNDQLLDAAHTGRRLPPGRYPFTAPLDLTDIVALVGSGAAETILEAIPGAGAPGPLLNLTTTFPGDVTIGLPNPPIVADLRVIGNGAAALEYGIQIHGYGLDCVHVTITNCHTGIVIAWGVGITFRYCLVSRNGCNLYVPGSGVNTMTTIAALGCNFREALDTGIVIEQAIGVLFDDWTIIEANKGAGLIIAPVAGGHVRDVRLGAVWFEANGGPAIVDETGAITINEAFINQDH